MQFFYGILENESLITLSQEESVHCIKVLRKKVNEEIIVVDGKGNMHKGIIIDPNPKRCLVRIEQTIHSYCPLPYYLHVAIAPTKNHDRLEWFIEKATEIGISCITLLHTYYSERYRINLERLEKIAIAAMKQSLKAYKPIIYPLQKFEAFISSVHTQHKFIAHCNENIMAQKKPLHTVYYPQNSVTLLIGPEGDFSSDEINLALQYDFVGVSLGNNRLRTETAGLYACVIISDLHARI